jgi:hypothetical protein
MAGNVQGLGRRSIMLSVLASKPCAWESKSDRVIRLRQEILEMHMLKLRQQVCEKDRRAVDLALHQLSCDILLLDPLNLESSLEELRVKYPEVFSVEETGRHCRRQRIELECPPGSSSPGELIPHLLNNTGLPQREPVVRTMGCWAWDYSDIPSSIWAPAKDLLAERIEKLYTTGIIRYGSWQ